eukprot:GCRY01001851.1.p1 GENE.GCRY01001851.1~~GCRY01001851.1.p1  ORF type:complete len:487 (+),score=84.03 GCRY01001851.1:191-1651(+)
MMSSLLRRSFSRSVSKIVLPKDFRLVQNYEKEVGPLHHFLGLRFDKGSVLNLSRDEMIHLLKSTDSQLMHAVYVHANSITERFYDNKVHLRGLIEFSNQCEKNCGYCGLRFDNAVERYTMTMEQIVSASRYAHEQGYGTVMLQSGERKNSKHIDWVVSVIENVRETTHKDALSRNHLLDPDIFHGITVALSLGELSEDDYRRLKAAGADRYLVRIESSNPDLYYKIHPQDENHSWDTRVQCLQSLKKVGFITGSGVMVGLPGQTYADNADDVIFLRALGIDMIGIGPYVPQKNTPLGEQWYRDHAGLGPEELAARRTAVFNRATMVNALVRINLGNVNIASSTALATVQPGGQEIALTRGSNILMPNLTLPEKKHLYQLYDNKPALMDKDVLTREFLDHRVAVVGKAVGWNSPGHPGHFTAPSQPDYVAADVQRENNAVLRRVREGCGVSLGGSPESQAPEEDFGMEGCMGMEGSTVGYRKCKRKP